MDKAEVITTTLSFTATANSIIHAGCTPAFVDVNQDTFNLDSSLIDSNIRENTIAIEPVDVYGLPAELDAVSKIADAHGLSVVEDAAEAIGATYQGKKLGTISDLTCFSTYATKNFHTGEGGFITTDDDTFAEYMRSFRNQGQASRYNQTTLGYNYRMLEISAAIGLRQIPLINQLNMRRRENALRLLESLQKIDRLQFQRVDNPSDHSWYMLSARLREGTDRDGFVHKLNDLGVEADISWPTPIHLQPYYRDRYGFKPGSFPVSEAICKSVFQVPIQPFLSTEQIDRIATVIKSLLH